jgi:hypothetical protein
MIWRRGCASESIADEREETGQFEESTGLE